MTTTAEIIADIRRLVIATHGAAAIGDVHSSAGYGLMCAERAARRKASAGLFGHLDGADIDAECAHRAFVSAVEMALSHTTGVIQLSATTAKLVGLARQCIFI